MTSTLENTAGSIPRADRGFDARAVAALIGLLMMGLVNNQILSPVLRDIAASFQVAVSRIGATVTGYALAAAVAALVIGPMSDRIGRRRFLIAGVVVFALGSVTAGFSTTFVVFLTARIVTGASAGVISALVVATIADRVPYERRGRAMSWVASAYFAAPILFVPAAAWLADSVGWRAIYAVLTLAAALLAIALRQWVTEKEVFAKQGADPSRRGAERLGYLEFLKDRTRAAGAVSAFFVSGGVTVFILYLGAYLGERFGLSTTSIGLVFLLSGAASLVGALGAGPLSDRVGKKPVAIGGTLALVALLALVPAVEGGFLLYALLGMTGLAAASRVAPLQSLVTELVSQESRGAYVALRNTLSQLGIAASASLGALLYGEVGFESVCYVAAALSLVAAGLLWIIKEPASAEGLRLRQGFHLRQGNGGQAGGQAGETETQGLDETTANTDG